MPVEKFPSYQPVLAKRSSGAIEVWQVPDNGETNDGRQMAYSQEAGGVHDGSPIYDSKRIATDRDSQEALARELAGMPLRGDNVVGYDSDGQLIEGVFGEPYELDGVKHASMTTNDGRRLGMYMEHAKNSSQELLMEQLRKSGSATLRAVGVETPTESVQPAIDERKMNQARAAADHKYNSVIQATGDYEAAEAAADRVWKGFGF